MADKLLKVGSNRFGIATSLKSDPNDFVYVSSDSRNIERVIGGISAGQEGEKVSPIFGLGLKHLEMTPGISSTFPTVHAAGGYVAVGKGGVVSLYTSNMQMLTKSKKLSAGSIIEVLVGASGVYVLTSVGSGGDISLRPFGNLDTVIASQTNVGSFDGVVERRSGQNLSLSSNGDILLVSKTKAIMFTSSLSVKWTVEFNNSDGKLTGTPITNMVGAVRSCLILSNGNSLVSTTNGKILISPTGTVIVGVTDTDSTAFSNALQWNNTVYQTGSTSGIWKVNLADLTTSLVLSYSVGANQNGVRFAKLSDDGFLYVSKSGSQGVMSTISKYDLNSLRFVWELTSKFINSQNLPSSTTSNYCALAVDDMGYIYAANEAYTMMVTENLVLKGYEVNV